MSANRKLIAALTTGAVLGAAAGLLLAPKTGKETREVVATHSGQLRHKAGRYISNIRGRENNGQIDGKVQISSE